MFICAITSCILEFVAALGPEVLRVLRQVIDSVFVVVVLVGKVEAQMDYSSK